MSDTEQVCHYDVLLGDGQTLNIHGTRIERERTEDGGYDITIWHGDDIVGEFSDVQGWAYYGVCDTPPDKPHTGLFIQGENGPPAGYHGVN